MQALHAGRHPTGRDAGNLWHIQAQLCTCAVAITDEGLVSPLIGRGQLRFIHEALLKLSHQPTRFESRNSCGRTAVG
jgi:hypothetical protein